MQAACAGFLVALEDGSAYVRSGLRKKVVVVAAEKMSSMTNYQDRATCPLFGDGAGAMLLEPTEENVGVMDGVFHVDGEGLEHLWMPAGGSVLPASHETVDAQQHFVIQDGRNVYKNAVTDMLESSLEVMNRNGLTVDNIDWFVSHQANLRIIEAVGSRLGIDNDKVLVNIEKYGNTSAASVPLCLDEYQDRLKKGDKIILPPSAQASHGALCTLSGISDQNPDIIEMWLDVMTTEKALSVILNGNSIFSGAIFVYNYSQ